MKNTDTNALDIDLLMLLSNAPTLKGIKKTMRHLAKENKQLVPALFKALPVELKTNHQVLQQAFSLIADPQQQADMALDLIKTKLPLAYLIPIMKPLLQAFKEDTALFKPYLDQATITRHQTELLALPYDRRVGFLVALDQLKAKDSETLFTRAWAQTEQWESQITASSIGIPYSHEGAVDSLETAHRRGDDIMVAYFSHNLSDQFRTNETVLATALGLLTRLDFFGPKLVKPILDTPASEKEHINALLLIIKVLSNRSNLLALYLDPHDATTAVSTVESLNDNQFADLLLDLHRINRSDSRTVGDLIPRYLDAPQWIQDSPIIKSALNKAALPTDDNMAAIMSMLTMDSVPDSRADDESEPTLENRVRVILDNITNNDLRAKALKIVFKHPNDVMSGLRLYLDNKTLDYAASRNEMKRDKDYFVTLFMALVDIKDMDLSKNESLPALEKYLLAHPDSYLIAKYLMHRTLESKNPRFSLQIYAKLPKHLKILPDLTRLYLKGIKKSSSTVNPDQLKLIPELAISLSGKAAKVYRAMQEQMAKTERE